MEYSIVEDTSANDLEADVNELIEDGWEPIGGVSVVHHEWDSRKGYTEDEFVFYQAMVKRAAIVVKENNCGEI